MKMAIEIVVMMKALDDLILRKSGASELPAFWPYKKVQKPSLENIGVDTGVLKIEVV